MALIKELRCIVLDRDEVKTIACDTPALKNIGHEVYAISRVDLSMDRHSVTATVRFHGNSRVKPIALGAAEFDDAVRTFCLRNRIPVPVHGAKFMSVMQDSLLLVVKKG